MRAMLLAMLVGCGGARARLEYGGIPAAVQQLHDEGWLAAFQEGSCRPLLPDEELPPGPAPITPAEREAEDALEATLTAEFEEPTPEDMPAPSNTNHLAADEQLDALIGGMREERVSRRRTPECRLATQRLQSIQRQYRDASGEDLERTHEAIEALAPGPLEGELCPTADSSLFGAELAVARFMSAMSARERTPFGFASRSCTLPTLGGSVAVRVEASEEETGPGGYDYYALNGFVQRCTVGVEGHPDGCIRAASPRRCNEECEADGCCAPPYLEHASAAPGTVTLIVVLSRAAMGCGSDGARAYHVRHDGSQWRVVRDEVIYHGLHGQ